MTHIVESLPLLTVEQTALILATVLNRSEQNRARISEKTIKTISRRSRLKSAFVLDLISTLSDRHEWIMCELAIGGYGAVQAKTLEAAKPVTAKRWLTDEEQKDLRLGKTEWEKFVKEAAPQQEQAEDEE